MSNRWLDMYNDLTEQAKISLRLICPCERNMPHPCIIVGATPLCDLDFDQRKEYAISVLRGFSHEKE